MTSPARFSDPLLSISVGAHFPEAWELADNTIKTSLESNPAMQLFLKNGKGMHIPLSTTVSN